jgi:hypothetical protein
MIGAGPTLRLNLGTEQDAIRTFLGRHEPVLAGLPWGEDAGTHDGCGTPSATRLNPRYFSEYRPKGEWR